jgi:hypothetical protein
VAKASTPVDRFFDLSVGRITPARCAVMIPWRNCAVVDATGFRYLRFHGIFHDILGTVKKGPDGAITYDWTGIDKLYDDLKARHLPLCRTGLYPDAMKTSEQTIFWWKGNTSHPQLGPWRDLVSALSAMFRTAMARRCASLVFRAVERAQPRRILRKSRSGRLFRALCRYGARSRRSIRRCASVGRPRRARHGCPNSWPMRMARACRSISSRRTLMALMAVS